MPKLPTELADADEATVRAALEELNSDISKLREQTRQADVKAGTVLTVIGLVLAAATVVMPRLEGTVLALAIITLVLVIAAAPLLGAAVLPRPGGRLYIPSEVELVDSAIDRVLKPRKLLTRRAKELRTIIAVSKLKHRLVQIALFMLGAAFIVAMAAAVTLAVAALS